MVEISFQMFLFFWKKIQKKIFKFSIFTFFCKISFYKTFLCIMKRCLLQMKDLTTGIDHIELLFKAKQIW